MEITKESEKILCCLYKVYLVRRKNGIPKSTAKKFEDTIFQEDKHLRTIERETANECLCELQRHGYIWTNILGDIKLEDKSIVSMENRFKNGLEEVVDALGKLIPLFPLV